MMKQEKPLPKEYEDIEMPKSTAMGIYISIFAFIASFAIVWHILWLLTIGLIGIIACIIVLSFDEKKEYHISAAQLAKMDHIQ